MQRSSLREIVGYWLCACALSGCFSGTIGIVESSSSGSSSATVATSPFAVAEVSSKLASPARVRITNELPGGDGDLALGNAFFRVGGGARIAIDPEDLCVKTDQRCDSRLGVPDVDTIELEWDFLDALDPDGGKTRDVQLFLNLAGFEVTTEPFEIGNNLPVDISVDMPEELVDLQEVLVRWTDDADELVELDLEWRFPGVEEWEVGTLRGDNRFTTLGEAESGSITWDICRDGVIVPKMPEPTRVEVRILVSNFDPDDPDVVVSKQEILVTGPPRVFAGPCGPVLLIEETPFLLSSDAVHGIPMEVLVSDRLGRPVQVDWTLVETDVPARAFETGPTGRVLLTSPRSFALVEGTAPFDRNRPVQLLRPLSRGLELPGDWAGAVASISMGDGEGFWVLRGIGLGWRLDRVAADGAAIELGSGMGAPRGLWRDAAGPLVAVESADHWEILRPGVGSLGSSPLDGEVLREVRSSNGRLLACLGDRVVELELDERAMQIVERRAFADLGEPRSLAWDPRSGDTLIVGGEREGTPYLTRIDAASGLREPLLPASELASTPCRVRWSELHARLFVHTGSDLFQVRVGESGCVAGELVPFGAPSSSALLQVDDGIVLLSREGDARAYGGVEQVVAVGEFDPDARVVTLPASEPSEPVPDLRAVTGERRFWRQGSGRIRTADPAPSRFVWDSSALPVGGTTRLRANPSAVNPDGTLEPGEPVTTAPREVIGLLAEPEVVHLSANLLDFLVVDLFGDGVERLITSSGDPSGGAIEVLDCLGGVPTPIDYPWFNPLQIQAADIDGNGRLDLAALLGISAPSSSLGNAIIVALQSESSTAASPRFDFVRVSGVPDPSDLLITDLDGDRLPDLAVTSRGQHTVAVFLQQEDGSFGGVNDEPSWIGGGFECSALPYSLDAADLDRDSRPDLVVASAGRSLALIFTQREDGGFGLESGCADLELDASAASAIHGFDQDADGDVDLAVGATSPSGAAVVIFGNDGTGRGFTREEFSVDDCLGGAPGSRIALITDIASTRLLREEGAPQLIVRRGNSTVVLVDGQCREFCVGCDASAFDPRASLAAPPVDWNGDGSLDLLFGSESTIAVSERRVGLFSDERLEEATLLDEQLMAPPFLFDGNADGSLDLHWGTSANVRRAAEIIPRRYGSPVEVFDGVETGPGGSMGSTVQLVPELGRSVVLALAGEGGAFVHASNGASQESWPIDGDLSGLDGADVLLTSSGVELDLVLLTTPEGGGKRVRSFRLERGAFRSSGLDAASADWSARARFFDRLSPGGPAERTLLLLVEGGGLQPLAVTPPASFDEPPPILLPRITWRAFHVDDLDLDGRDDVVGFDEDSNLRIAFQQLSGFDVRTIELGGELTSPVQELATADMDGDASQDIVLASGERVYVLLQQTPRFALDTKPRRLMDLQPGEQLAAVADVDFDGTEDLLLWRPGSARVVFGD